MPNNNNRINFQVGYNVDQASVNAVKKSLQDLQNIKVKDFSGTKTQLDQIKQVAGKVESALTKAFNVNLNSLNTQQFNASLKEAGLSVDKIYTSFSKAGAQGQVAFSRMASEVLTTNMQLKQTNSLVSQMGETMANTVKWGIASSVMNNFINSVQQAFQYVKSLDSALTDIRIVTGDSTEQMKQFAIEANNAAQSLGRSTMDYTKAALTFYQQGLSDEDVQARTEAVLKAQNITGAGEEMADYLTAVWNGYKVANEEAELYVDKLASVADSSASNMSQLAIAMSKVASTANAMGVDVDQLNAQIATIVATTRQAPESVGNALKTIYSRINDISTGAEDAEISLGNYSSKMMDVGISVLDANGNLRDTGEVIEEIGGKWSDLSREQQIYLARTMAGQRQYNNLIALFDNWSRYSDLVNVSMESQGTLVEKNSRYMESLGAKMEQLGAAGERVKSAMINEEDLKGLVDFGTGAVNLFGSLIESIGGGRGALLAFGSIFTQVFSGTIAKELNNVITNFQNVKSNAEQLLQLEKSISLFGASKGYQDNSPAIRTMVDLQKDMLKYSSVLTIQQRNQYHELVKEIGQEENKKFLLQQQNKKAKEFAQIIASANKIKLGENFKQYTSELSDGMIRAATAAEKVQKLMQQTNAGLMASATKKQQSGFTIFKEFTNQVDELNRATNNSLPSFDRYTEAILAIKNPLHPTKDEIIEVRLAAKALAEQFNKKYDNYEQSLDSVDSQLAQILNKLGLLKKSASDIKNSTSQLFNVTSIVKTASSIGQFASAISSLTNLKNIWSNQNLSSSQKILQTVTNLGMAIPMLITSYKSLNSTLGITNTLKTLFGGITKVNTAAIGAETAAQYGLNAAMEANPIGVIVLGITAAITAITALVKIYDHFTMSVKEADQAIESFNQKQKQIADGNANLASQTAELENLKEQYDQLAKKAGAVNFDSTIDNLTEAERTRYNQIKNLIVSYNEDALAGYNAQGEAILLNNTRLQETIALLKEQHQLQIDETYGGKEYKQAVKGRNVQYQDAQNTITERQNRIDELKTGVSFDDAFSNLLYGGGATDGINQLAYNEKLFEQQITKIKEIQKDGIENIHQHEDELDQILQSIIEKAENNNQYLITAQAENLKQDIENIKEYGQYLSEAQGQLALAEDELKNKAKIDPTSVLGFLQQTGQNQQYNSLAQQYGESLLNGIITNFIDGLDRVEYDQISAAQAVKQKILKILLNAQLSEKDIQSYQKKQSEILQSLAPDQTNIGQYRKKISSFIMTITHENEQLYNLLKDYPDFYNSLIKSVFGFDEFSASLDHQGSIILSFKDDTIQDYDSAKAEIEKYFKDNPIDYSSIKEVGKKQSSKQQRLSGQELKVEVASAVEAAQMADEAVIEEFLNQDFNLDLLDNVDLFLSYLDKIEVESGNVKQALDQAAEATRNYASAMEGISTFDLLQQASIGELDDQQFSQLSTQLDGLVDKQLVAEETADILKNKWIQGTDAYKQALGEVSNILLNEFQQSLQADPSGLQEISGSLKNLITNTETLHQAQSMELLTQEDHYDILGRLGSQYDSCSDELELFAAALASGDQELINSTADALALAIQMEQTKASSELIAESMSQLNDLFMTGQINGQQFGKALKEVSDAEMEALGFDVDQYEDWVNILQDLNPQLEQNQYLARQMAKANMRISKGMDDLIANFDQWNDALLDFQENGDVSRLVDSWDQIRQTMANLFDSDAQTIDMLGPDFIANNMDKIQAVKDGVDGAYEELSALMDQQLILNAYGVSDFSQLDQDIQDAYNQIQAVNNDATIEVGAVFSGQDDLLDAFNRIVAGANWTSEQAQAAFAQMGYDVQIEPKNPEMHEDTENTQYYVPPTWTTQDVPYNLGPFGSGNLSIPIVSRGGHYESAGGGVKQTYEPGAYAIRTVTKNGKGSGGNISRGNAKSSAPRGGGGRRGGGGGGKSKAPSPATQAKVSTAKIQTKPKTSTPNPYEQEEKSFDRQSKILDQLQDKQKKLVNKDRLKNLQQQNKTLEEQRKILEKELAISTNSAEENSTADYARRLKNEFGDLFKLDADGQISNINALEKSATDSYNKAAKAAAKAFDEERQKYNDYILNTWNLYATKDQQELHKDEKQYWEERVKNAETAAKNAIKDAEDEYKVREDLIKQYNDAWKDDQQRAEKIKQITDQIYENRIAASKIGVDLSIDTGEFERDWLDFENKFIKKLNKDDFLGSAKASAKELMSYFNSEQIQKTADQIKSIRDEIDIMNQGGTSQTYGNNLAQAQEDLEDYMKQQMDDLGDIQDLVDDIKDNYLDALDNAKDKMDDQIDQYERVNDLIEHNVKLTQMLYGDKAYNTMDKYYELQKANNKDQLQSLRMQQQYWQNLMKNQTEHSPAWNQMKKNLDDVTDNLNSKLEDMIENLSNQWQNRVDGIIAKLNNGLTGGRGLDYLDEQWDYINSFDDNFLDTFESKMGIQEVTDLYQQAIDGLSGSPAQQQKINKLMNEQLKILREKDNLTQYDIDRAKAALEVEKARMALEDARYNKTKMRLRRDSQGNYTYQYVADEQKLGDLQAALADAQANLYNMDKEHYTQNLNTLYDAYKDYIDKMRELTEEYNNTQDAEERARIQARIDLLRQSTNNLMQGLTEDNKYALQYLNESFFGGMGIDTTLLSADEQMEIMIQNIPQMQSNIQDLANTLVGEGGILNATNDAMKQISDATVEYDKNVRQFLTDAGSSLQVVTNVTDAAGNALDKNIQQANDLITTNQKLIDECNAQVDAIQKLLSWLDQYLNKVMDVQTLISNLRSAYGTGQQLNGSNLIADQINVESMGLDTTAGMNFTGGMDFTGNPKTDAATVKHQIDRLMAQYEKFLTQMAIATFDTGGSTGSWGDAEGRLAFLHQKELVLNQQDTANILAAVEAVRMITGSLNGLATGEIGSLINNATGLLGGIDTTSTLDQNVHIEANFPNVTQHTEIEQAFNNLVNMASMRASGYRD